MPSSRRPTGTASIRRCDAGVGSVTKAWWSEWAQAALSWAGSIGSDAQDGSEVALQKRLVVLLCVGTICGAAR